MDRSEAARLLGVPEDADAALIRRAYRTWARITHPDLGGDPTHFARLAHARRTRLRPIARDQRPMPTPAPRVRLAAVLRRPRQWTLLVLAILPCLAAVALPLIGIGPVIASLLAGLASATWAWWVTRTCLRTGADAGHRIVMLTVTWLPLAAAQIALSALLGTTVIETLPVLALPFVAVVASVNMGAGLWRPIR